MSKQATRVWWVLRIGAAACFIGHGAFGIIGKEAWLPYFAVAGIGPDTAFRLMPVIGTIDLLAGISVLLRPRLVVLLYMTIWGFWTAALRPLSGDALAEMIERAGNYGVPLALTMMCEWPTRRSEWFRGARRRDTNELLVRRLSIVLLATTATLLAGHALLAIGAKPVLVRHAGALGIDGGAQSIGKIELMLVALVLSWPSVVVMALVSGWKLASESLFLVTGAPVWEFIERGGSYAAPLALVLLAQRFRLPRLSFTALVPRTVAAAALAIVAMFATPNLAIGQRGPSEPARPADDVLLGLLRKGGLALACRHSITDHSHEDMMPIDYTDRSKQRNLSAAGERQAREIGSAISAARIPIGQVYSNPLFRTRETATLAFGRVAVMDSLGDNGVLGRMLRQRVPAGETRVFITRNGMLSNAFRGISSSFEEGDCMLVEPQDSAFHFITRLRPADWARLSR